jgi:SAM-dependent methyltransferase
LKPSFLDIVVCPKCGSQLQLSGSTEQPAEEGELKCQNAHSFPIIGGIPRFVSSELYVENFGFEWNVHAVTQLDSASSDESERTFRAKTGFNPEDVHGRLILDVGCGMGRFSDVVSRWGGTVVGIDLSRAVEAAQRNIGGRENVNIAQADIFQLPFRDETFDFIFSIGVLHHTPNTKAAFECLPRLLRKNGRIAIWVYTGYSPAKWLFSDFYRRFTPMMPKRFLHAISHVAVPLYFIQKVPILGRIVRWILPVSSDPDPEWRVLDTFDWYSPKYQWKHSYEEVFPWFEENGLTSIKVLKVPVGIQGTKP